ncbi:efflux RND transporter periplasmic adaptor subunit [Burkholderia sp. 22PA0106]|uniref:efflux RND transporter periplasmic adaptor subunit n=1 Tax=Burkholderia sp. 22PA0106 TaxID=3237371 RepID=UPI0039C2997A
MVIVGLAVIVWLFAIRPEPPQYLTATVTRGDLDENVLATGTIHPSQQVSIGAQVNGQIQSIPVKLGDRVRRGQLLATIDPQLEQNALRSAQASLDSARAQRDSKRALLTQYLHELDRQAFMLQHDASSRANYEVAQGNVDTTRADLASLNAQILVSSVAVDNARTQLSYTHITAPMDGEIIAMVAQPGQTVVAAQIVPVLMILANLDTVTVRAKISEADVVRVKPGMPVHFTILGDPDRQYDSRLRAVEPAPESIVAQAMQPYQSTQSQAPAAIYYNGLFDVANPQRTLRASMTAQVSFVLGHAANALILPRAALGKRLGAQRYEVRVLAGEAAQAREIRVGLMNDTDVQVLSGLAAGEHVIVGTSLDQALKAAAQGNGA